MRSPHSCGSADFRSRSSGPPIVTGDAGDVSDLERVRETSLIEVLVDTLPSRVGSPLSVKNLRQDLDVAHDTVERWLTILENLYVCSRIAPFGAPRIRAVKKDVLVDGVRILPFATLCAELGMP
jgi:hypothetical protein